MALGDSAKHELASKPTQSLPAYEAFLRGEAASQGMSGRPAESPPGDCGIRAGGGARFELCPGLGAARAGAGIPVWEYLATPAVAEAARRAAERALALAPTRPEGHQALGAYYLVLRDYPRALTEDSTALALAPGNAELLGDVGQAEASSRPLGGGAGAPGAGCPARSPLSHSRPSTSGSHLLYTRHYPEAERALDHALQLAPANLLVRHTRAMVALAQGDLPGAQAVLRAAPKEVDPTALVAVRGHLQRPHVGAGRGPAAAPAAAHAERVRRRPRAMGRRARPDLRASGRQCEGARVRRLGPAGLRAAASSDATGRFAPRRSSDSTWPTWDRRRPRSGKASAAWRSCRSAATL